MCRKQTSQSAREQQEKCVRSLFGFSSLNLDFSSNFTTRNPSGCSQSIDSIRCRCKSEFIPDRFAFWDPWTASLWSSMFVEHSFNRQITAPRVSQPAMMLIQHDFSITFAINAAHALNWKFMTFALTNNEWERVNNFLIHLMPVFHATLSELTQFKFSLKFSLKLQEPEFISPFNDLTLSTSKR